MSLHKTQEPLVFELVVVLEESSGQNRGWTPLQQRRTDNRFWF